MSHVMYTFRVENYDKWCLLSDFGEGMRKATGIVSMQAYQDSADPNWISMIIEFQSTENARKFIYNEKLNADMAAAGIIGAPEVTLLSPI